MIREVDPREESAKRSSAVTILTLSASASVVFVIIFASALVGMVGSGSYGFGPSWAMGFAAIAGLLGGISVLFRRRAYQLLTTPRNMHEPTDGRISWYGALLQAIAIVVMITTSILY